jgi:hypothetical protein
MAAPRCTKRQRSGREHSGGFGTLSGRRSESFVLAITHLLPLLFQQAMRSRATRQLRCAAHMALSPLYRSSHSAATRLPKSELRFGA